jgi:hypothetical protein
MPLADQIKPAIETRPNQPAEALTPVSACSSSG